MLGTILKKLGMSPDGDYVGTIAEFAGSYAPMNYVLCSGQLLECSKYPALFSIIGTKYGGDGIKTFAIPDFRPLDKNGNKLDWTDWRQYNGPVKVICIEGWYPSRP